METPKFVLKDTYTNQDYFFDNNVNFINDQTLIKNISKPNIKNQSSSFVISSSNDLHISDVVQVKINISDTGYFLVSFLKENLNDETRSELLKEISGLKSDTSRTSETETKKIQELVGILNKYSPLYATFKNDGEIEIETNRLSELQLDFPLLVLPKNRQKIMLNFGRTKQRKKPQECSPKEKDETKKEKIYKPFPLFDLSCFFIMIFSLLGSFSTNASVFEIMNKKGIAAFFIVLSLVFAITLVIAVHSTLYKKGVVKNPYQRYYLSIFIIIGIAAGITASYFICQNVLRTNIESFDYKLMFLFSVPISALALLSSLSSCRLMNLIIKLSRK